MLLAGVYSDVLNAVLRWVAPLMVLVLMLRCLLPLLTFRREPEIWGWLCQANGDKHPITHWETIIGSGRFCDIVIDDPKVAKSHCVLTRYDDGSWSIAETDASDGLYINQKRREIWELQAGDVVTIGGVDLELQPTTRKQEKQLAQIRTKASSFFSGFGNLLLLTAFQSLCALGYVLGGNGENVQSVILGFGGIMILQWLLMLFYLFIRRTSFEVETVAFLLTTMGMCAICAVAPGEAVKQVVAVALGLVAFLAVGISLRDLERAKKVRYLAAVAGIGLLLITLIFGTEYNGAKNWLMIGPMSLQPSELSKVCFVLVGASAMDRLVKKRNLILFIAYSVTVCGCLALMNDFGTALIFFFAFLVIAYLRSGSLGTVALAITALVFAGMIALKIAPHAVQRFANWRHIWEEPWDGGYQQTRALMCMASGGFLGLGPGQGWMKNLFAADSDVVIATITEEWGLLIAVMLILSVIALAAFVVRTSAMGRSSFYTISACAAVCILVVQVILNALGTVDVVPLTGVTFPFLSNGGSSMICSWGLLGFIKAADTRQNASFAVRLPRKGGKDDE